MGSTWLILSPGFHPSTGNQNVWFGPSPPQPGPAPAPLPWRWEAVEGIADFGRVGMGWGVGGGRTKCVCGEKSSKSCGRANITIGRPTPPPRVPRTSKTPPHTPPQVLGIAAPPSPSRALGLLHSARFHTPPPDLRPAATPPRLTLADPHLPPDTKEVASGMKANLAPAPSACSCPQPPGPAPAPPPPAPKEGAGTLSRGGMNQTLRG